MDFRPFGRTGKRVSALGFGCMRFPQRSDNPADIDRDLAVEMVRAAVDRGVNYIDTAYPYHDGQSEVVVGQALNDGYRSKVMLATKLPTWLLTSEDDVERLLDEQLGRLGQNSVDVYLAHNLGPATWPLFVKHRALEKLEKARREGKFTHLGFSFHGPFDLFKEIVEAHDGWDIAQIQYNYANERVQAGTAGLAYGAAQGLAMVIMEPLLVGCLANPPPRVAEAFARSATQRSAAEWALRWLWHKPEVGTVLSGMSTMSQVEQNIAAAERAYVDCLDESEASVVAAAAAAYEGAFPIPCTACRYCMPCPHHVDIPGVFGLYNGIQAFGGNQGMLNRLIYQGHMSEDHAGLCVACGECMEKCPQEIDVASWMPKVHEVLSQAPARGQ